MNQSNKYIKVLSPQLILPLALFCVIVVSLLLVYEYRAQQRDYLALLQKQAATLNNVLSRSTNSAIIAAEIIEDTISEQILANLKSIEMLDQGKKMSQRELDSFLNITGHDGLRIYGKDGNLLLQATRDSRSVLPLSETILHHRMKKTSPDTIITLIDYDNPGNERLAAFVRRKKGGLIVATINNEDIRSMRRALGIGHVLMNYQSDDNIEFIVIQNRETIVAGSFNGYKLSSFSKDQILQDVMNDQQTRSRISWYGGESIYETISPFYLHGNIFGNLRIGMSMHEYERLRSDMKKRFYIFGAVLLVVGVIMINFLISYRHRKLLQRDIAWLSEYTNNILENLSGGVISIDSNGIIRSINKQALVLLDVNFETVIYGSYSKLPPVMHTIIAPYLLSGETTPSETKVIIENKQDEKKTMSVRTYLMNDENADKTCIVLIDDITDITHLEEQRRINQRLDDIQKMASSVAHEINNPLNSIQLIMGLIRKKYALTVDNKEHRELLDTVRTEVNRISTIIGQYLQFARPPKMNFLEMDMTDVLRDVMMLFEADMKKKNIATRQLIDFSMPFYGDGNQLKQVFINIVKNAMEACEDSGEITITGKAAATFYEIKVRDTGIGIPNSLKDSIFDFHYTTKKDGSGIGLFVVQQIVNAHDGTISIESREGHGTTFILKFPVKTGNAALSVENIQDRGSHD